MGCAKIIRQVCGAMDNVKDVGGEEDISFSYIRRPSSRQGHPDMMLPQKGVGV